MALDNSEKYNYDMQLIENFLHKEEFNDILILNVQLYSANLEKAIPFRDYLMKLIKEGKKKILIDLTNVDYIDSTFLGSLVFVLKKIKSEDGKMKLVFENKSKATTMFEITNMDKVFDVYHSLEEAKNSF